MQFGKLKTHEGYIVPETLKRIEEIEDLAKWKLQFVSSILPPPQEKRFCENNFAIEVILIANRQGNILSYNAFKCSPLWRLPSLF